MSRPLGYPLDQWYFKLEFRDSDGSLLEPEGDEEHDVVGDVDSGEFRDDEEWREGEDPGFDVALKSLYHSEDFKGDELEQMGNEDLLNEEQRQIYSMLKDTPARLVGIDSAIYLDAAMARLLKELFPTIEQMEDESASVIQVWKDNLSGIQKAKMGIW
jgi:hypothetical protein